MEYRNLTPRSDVEKEKFSLALSKLDDIASERRNRLNIAAAELPTMLRVLVAIGIVLLLLLEYRPQLSLGASLAFMGGLAAIVTSAYLLTLVLNYPFASDVSVSNDPLKRDRLATFWDRELAYREQDGDTARPLEPSDLRGIWNSRRIRNARPALLQRAVTGRTPESASCLASAEQSDDWYGVYRYHNGVVTGRLDPDDGVFRGWWYEEPRRIEDEKAATGGRVQRKVVNGGALAWRGVRRSDKTLIVGCWIYGRVARNDPYKAYDVHPGWDLVPLATDAQVDDEGNLEPGALDEPNDLAARFVSIKQFRSAPHVPRTRPTVHDCAHNALSPAHARLDHALAGPREQP